MITCCTLPGKAVCKLVWDMGKRKNHRYLELALSGIPKDFSGRMMEVPVGTGVLTMPLGRWQIVRESNASHKKVGYWINTLYSPFVRFSEIVKEFLDSKDDPDKFQNFTNSWLAEPWEDTKLKTSADTVMERQTKLLALYGTTQWDVVRMGKHCERHIL